MDVIKMFATENIAGLGYNYTEYLPQPNTDSFFLAHTTLDEISSELRFLPESKANDVLIKIIKASIKQLSTYLRKDCKCCFVSGNYIDELKYATISPAHTGDPKSCLTN